MRIGISAVLVGSGSGGIETYVRNLVPALAQIDQDNEYLLYTRDPLPESFVPPGGPLRQVVIPIRHKGKRPLLAFSRVSAGAHLDVIHEQTVAPFLFGTPLVITVHDLYHCHYGQFYNRLDLARTRLSTAATYRRAKAIIADSIFTKEDIIRYYGVPPHKITVAYLAAAPLFKPIHNEAQLSATREKYAQGQRFILSVGALKETKNLSTVIAAYVQLRHNKMIAHKLLLTGGATPWLKHDIFTQARRSGYEDDIIFTGFVPEEDLAALYNAADLFVHPSLFEGFGLPPLEAMACGTPVITANTTATPEVVGDAALMIDPHDVEGLAAAIVNVLSDEQQQARLSRLGLARAATFSWTATARTVLDVYRRVAST